MSKFGQEQKKDKIGKAEVGKWKQGQDWQ